MEGLMFLVILVAIFSAPAAAFAAILFAVGALIVGNFVMFFVLIAEAFVCYKIFDAQAAAEERRYDQQHENKQ